MLDGFKVVADLKAAKVRRDLWIVTGMKYDADEPRRKNGLPRHAHMLTVAFHSKRKAQAAARYWKATKEYHYVGVNGNYWSD